MSVELAITFGFTGVTAILAYLAKDDEKISITSGEEGGEGRLNSFTPWKDFFVWTTTMFLSTDIFIISRMARSAGLSSIYGVLDFAYLLGIIIVVVMTLYMFVKYFADMLSAVFGGDYGI